MNPVPCHICHSENLHSVAMPAKEFTAVSSDIRLVKGRLEFSVCADCNSLQKNINDEWKQAVAEVYREYEINHQGSGAEPYIFNSQFGNGPRAEILLKFFTQAVPMPQKGKLLDIGCGNGNVLRNFNTLFPSWELYGLENSTQWEKNIRSIPGVKDFFVEFDEVKGQRFDAIVMSHVLEHIPDPATFLKRLGDHLTPSGKVLIAVPNIRQNPIDLFVMDHCTHFDDETLQRLLERSGLDTRYLTTDCLPKEIIAVVGAGESSKRMPAQSKYIQTPGDFCAHYFQLSVGMRDQASNLRKKTELFGIFGTSTAAVWLTGQLAKPADFYVDEDPSRIGGKLLDKPIYGLAQIPPGAAVFIPMAKSVAERIIARMGNASVTMQYLDSNEISLASKMKDEAA